MVLSRRDFLKAAAAGVAGGILCPRLMPASAAADPTARPAFFYRAIANGLVECGTCPHGCVIPDGGRGRCRTKENRGGRLYTLSYGNPCAVHVDPVEKKPLNHFFPGIKAFSIAVAGCNFSCLNCQNWEISQTSPDKTRNYDLPPARVVESAIRYGCRAVAFTYSEPITFYEYMFDTASLARARGLKTVWVSNAYLKPGPVEKLCGVIDAAVLNLKSFSEKTYQSLNGGSLAPVLETLKIVKSKGVWLEIVNLVIPTYTDDMAEISRMSAWIAKNLGEDQVLHVIRFTPLYRLTHLPPTPEETLKKAEAAARREGLKYVYIGNVPGLGDTVFCKACGKALVKKDGFMVLENKVRGGRCPFCGAAVPGRWDAA